MKNRNTRKRISLALVIICIAVGVASFTLVFLQSLKGETKTTGKYLDSETSDFLNCTIVDLGYPFFSYFNAETTNTKINIVFKDEKISSVSLNYEMLYQDANSAKASSAINHASMNQSFGNALGANALGADYYVNSNSMRMTLYVHGDAYNDLSKKYFLINPSTEDDVTSIKQNFINQGFDCNTNE